MASDFDVVVIGAGVIGLAVARALALSGRSVLIVEQAEHFGAQTSSRNSEVIHAGIYYPPESRKARLCIAGREMLYRFCRDHGVPHRRCGKLIVAVEAEQLSELEVLAAGAKACGVEGLAMLSAADAGSLEKELSCVGALHSPATGIIDSHSYMQALLGSAEAHDAVLVCNTQVTQVRRAAGIWTISIAEEEGPVASARAVVNASGLAAADTAMLVEDFPAAHVPRLRFAKGTYFSYAGRTPFSRLIYPLPEPGGLGVHLTLDMAGRARFGPDVQWVERIDYSVDPRRRHAFAQSIRRFWPAVDPQQLHPDYAGIRPKLSGPGEPSADFIISGPGKHGHPGIFNLFGIESPGLTASLAIADEVCGEVARVD